MNHPNRSGRAKSTRLARAHEALQAVLLFHGAPAWGDSERLRWLQLTGKDEATTRVLCDTVRDALADAPEPTPEIEKDGMSGEDLVHAFYWLRHMKCWSYDDENVRLKMLGKVHAELYERGMLRGITDVDPKFPSAPIEQEKL